VLHEAIGTESGHDERPPRRVEVAAEATVRRAQTTGEDVPADIDVYSLHVAGRHFSDGRARATFGGVGDRPTETRHDFGGFEDRCAEMR